MLAQDVTYACVDNHQEMMENQVVERSGSIKEKYLISKSQTLDSANRISSVIDSEH